MTTKGFYKIACIGNPSIVKRLAEKGYLGRGFRDEHYQRLGMDFMTYDLELPSGKGVSLQVFIFGSMNFSVNRFFNGAFGGIIFLNLNDPKKFENLMTKIERIWTNSLRGIIPIILMGYSQGRLESLNPGNVLAEINSQIEETVLYIDYCQIDLEKGDGIERGIVSLSERIDTAFEKGLISLNSQS